MRWVWVIAGWYVVLSIVSAARYVSDKRRARKGRGRIPESRLLMVDLVGGWPGGLLARRLVRHKTRKLSYRLMFWLVVGVHVGAWGAYLWWRSRGQ